MSGLSHEQQQLQQQLMRITNNNNNNNKNERRIITVTQMEYELKSDTKTILVTVETQTTSPSSYFSSSAKNNVLVFSERLRLKIASVFHFVCLFFPCHTLIVESQTANGFITENEWMRCLTVDKSNNNTLHVPWKKLVLKKYAVKIPASVLNATHSLAFNDRLNKSVDAGTEVYAFLESLGHDDENETENVCQIQKLKLSISSFYVSLHWLVRLKHTLRSLDLVCCSLLSRPVPVKEMTALRTFRDSWHYDSSTHHEQTFSTSIDLSSCSMLERVQLTNVSETKICSLQSSAQTLSVLHVRKQQNVQDLIGLICFQNLVVLKIKTVTRRKDGMDFSPLGELQNLLHLDLENSCDVSKGPPCNRVLVGNDCACGICNFSNCIQVNHDNFFQKKPIHFYLFDCN
jgi:hypothetical protein